HLRARRGRGCARRPRGEVLPHDPGGRGRARRARVRLRGRTGGSVTHTLSVLVENRPGALARVSNMFARRGFNIESLAVGPTERPNVSRITLRVDCAQESIEQIEKQMHKLVNVLRVNELEAALLKVNAPADRRGELLALAEVFSARVADLGPNAIIFEVVGSPEELDSFEELVR